MVTAELEQKAPEQLSQKEADQIYTEAVKNLVSFRYIMLQSNDGEVSSPPFHYKWSKELLEGTENKAFEGFRESAKALPLDTEIPTTHGFKTINEIEVGDVVFDMDGKEAPVLAVSEVFKDKKCYRVSFDDKTSLVATAEHLWYVMDKQKRKYKVLTTAEMLLRYQGWKHKNGYNERIFRVPVCKAVGYTKNDLKLDPYVLGFWLGDGNKDCPIFTIGDRDAKEVVAEFESRGYFLNRLPSDKYRYSLIGVRKQFTIYNLLYNKHVPDVYKIASVRDRLDLLCGLIDSDGTVARNGRKVGIISFCNTNKRLAYDTLEIVRSLGWKATITTGESKLYGRICGIYYKVSFKPDVHVSKICYKMLVGKVNARSKSKTIVDIVPVESVLSKCIGVKGKNNTFLATKDYIVTHNTQYVLRAFPLYCFTFPSIKRDYIVIIKNNSTLAENKLKEITQEYMSNPLVNYNMAKIHTQSGKVFSVDVFDKDGNIVNIRIEAYGKGASVRGLSNQDRRPKIVIIDDPQDVEDARSETVCKADWDWFLSDVTFLGKKSRIFMIGNNLGERCIIERVFDNAEDLGFVTERVPIEVDGIPTWPEMFDMDMIKAEKASFANMGKIDVWLRERMCVALSEENQTFNKKDYRYFEPSQVDTIVKDGKLTATLDPASSKEKESCFRAIVVNAVSQEDYWNIVDIRYGRWDSVELMDEIFNTVVKWKLRDFYIEKGMLEQVLEPFLIKEMPKRRVYFNIIPIEHAKEGNKLERIKLLGPRFKAHTIWFLRGAEWLTELLAELAGVTKEQIKSLFIDLVDALAMQEQCAKSPLRTNVAKTKHPKGRV